MCILPLRRIAHLVAEFTTAAHTVARSAEHIAPRQHGTTHVNRSVLQEVRCSDCQALQPNAFGDFTMKNRGFAKPSLTDVRLAQRAFLRACDSSTQRAQRIAQLTSVSRFTRIVA